MPGLRQRFFQKQGERARERGRERGERETTGYELFELSKGSRNAVGHILYRPVFSVPFFFHFEPSLDAFR